ncbi:GrpB family protein [Streptomyces sp. NPDC052000]|uniref:GrpB family protein n=1 Tax=Streptomyces sp. NPDC052000 TaxID=3155676 RepID=UPI00344FC848
MHSALKDQARAIDRIGSTAVPGLAAKDCVDIQVLVEHIDEDRQAALLAHEHPDPPDHPQRLRLPHRRRRHRPRHAQPRRQPTHPATPPTRMITPTDMSEEPKRPPPTGGSGGRIQPPRIRHRPRAMRPAP